MPALIPGLVSVTFRKLSPQEIVDLVVEAQLKAIEWGGDIHVPHGDLARAGEVRRQTLDAGLSVAAYGSYYRIGVSEAKGLSFESVLDTAAALDAPTIRVWAGGKGSDNTTASERKEVIADALRIAELAKARGVTASLEYHAGSLTDTRESIHALLKEISHSHLEFLWQPTTGESTEQCTARLQEVLPRLRHIHVFHWWPTMTDWLPLVEGQESWRKYLEVIHSTGRPMPCLLEFVRDHSPDQFLEDAVVLRRLLGLA